MATKPFRFLEFIPIKTPLPRPLFDLRIWVFLSPDKIIIKTELCSSIKLREQFDYDPLLGLKLLHAFFSDFSDWSIPKLKMMIKIAHGRNSFARKGYVRIVL
jgi:hypothetical protein